MKKLIEKLKLYISCYESGRIHNSLQCSITDTRRILEELEKREEYGWRYEGLPEEPGSYLLYIHVPAKPTWGLTDRFEYYTGKFSDGEFWNVSRTWRIAAWKKIEPVDREGQK